MESGAHENPQGFERLRSAFEGGIAIDMGKGGPELGYDAVEELPAISLIDLTMIGQRFAQIVNHATKQFVSQGILLGDVTLAHRR